MDLSAYRALFRVGGVLSVMFAALLARLPVIATMVPLAFLAKDLSGSFGWAGVVAGAQSIGMAIGGPMWSRLSDRRGAKPVLIGTGMVWSLAMAALAMLPGDLYQLMPVLSGLAGVMVPPVGSVMRATWPRLVEGRNLRTVYVVDATVQEFLFIFGPMLGALAVSFASPRFGLVAAAVTAGISIWWFGLKQLAALSRDEVGERLTTRELLWHRHRLPVVIVLGLCVFSFASVSLGIVAYADEYGNRLVAGVLESIWAIGSLIGGLVAGALPGRRTSHAWRWQALLSAGMLVCVFATWSPIALSAGLVCAGFAIAPGFGVLYERVGSLTPASVRTEIYGWMNSGAMLGGAIGSPVAGVMIESFGVRSVFAMAAGLTGVGAMLLVGIPPRQPAATGTVVVDASG